MNVLSIILGGIVGLVSWAIAFVIMQGGSLGAPAPFAQQLLLLGMSAAAISWCVYIRKTKNWAVVVWVVAMTPLAFILTVILFFVAWIGPRDREESRRNEAINARTNPNAEAETKERFILFCKEKGEKLAACDRYRTSQNDASPK